MDTPTIPVYQLPPLSSPRNPIMAQLVDRSGERVERRNTSSSRGPSSSPSPTSPKAADSHKTTKTERGSKFDRN